MSVEDLLGTGQRALEEGNLESATQSFRQILKQQESAEVWQLLAEAQIESGSFAQAHKSLAAGLKLEADNIDLLFSLGDLYLEEGNTRMAIATYQQIIALDPDEVDAWVSKAIAQLNSDDLLAAEQSCRQALELAPESAFAHNALGDICIAKNSTVDAMKCFHRSIKLDPVDPQPCLSLADLYYDADDLEQAEEYCQKGLELGAGLAPGYLILGYICLDQDRTQEAIDNFQQFLRLEKSPAAKYLRDEVSAVIDGLK